MSRVFVAEEVSLGRKVVVKVLNPALAATVSIQRFQREIMVVAKLNHPNIVPVLSAGEVDALPYFFIGDHEVPATISTQAISWLGALWST